MPPPLRRGSTQPYLWAVLLGAIFVVPYLRPIAIFLLPGLLLQALASVASKGPIPRLARTVATSLSFWIVCVWAASSVGLRLTTLFWLVSVVSGGIWVVLIARNPSLPSLLPKRPTHLIALASVLLLTLLPFFLTLAPPGADMSMHGYITRMVHDAGGVPSTYQPYLPIEKFGAFSIGFHTLAAMIASVSGGVLPIYRAVLLTDCLVYCLLFLVLWGTLAPRLGSNLAAASAAVGVFLSRNPQHFFAWGGTPTVLSIALITCALPALRQPRKIRLGEALLGALWLSAGFLSHPMPALVLATASVPYGVYLIWTAIRDHKLLRLVLPFLLIAIVCLMCISFFLVRFDSELSKDEAEWMQMWGSVTAERWHGTLLDAPLTLPLHLAEHAVGPLAILLGFAMLVAACSGTQEDRIDLYFVLAIVGIIVNARYQWLPGSAFLLPDRAGAMLPIFAAPLIGSMLLRTRNALADIISPRGLRQLARASFVVLACLCATGSYGYYIKPGLAEAPVTRRDLRAFEWIKHNTPPHTHIANNYSDAGIWIPMMTGRTVSVPHVNIINWSQTKLQLASRPARYIYIGARSVYSLPSEWTPARVESLQPRPKLAFRAGDARLYELQPSLAAAICADFRKLVEGTDESAGEIKLASPANSAVITRPRITLRWDTSECYLFNIQLSLCANFDNPLPIYNSYPALQLAGGSFDITALRRLMPRDVPIYWRIRGLPNGDHGVFESQVSSFVIK